MSGSDFKPPRERVEDALREIGTLLMTFAPLDASINHEADTMSLLIFFMIGIIVFAAALVLEKGRRNALK